MATSVDVAGGAATPTHSFTAMNLLVAGTPVDVSLPPNTRVYFPGLGHVLVNEQRSWLAGPVASASTTALRVVVTTAHTFGLRVGAQLIVADSAVQARC
ncbi:MAG: hypothetical protein GEV08_15845 [Acidimicrobiia bacterium]|nr:hypothetical protein [Acidimicrobiia bacterium]